MIIPILMKVIGQPTQSILHRGGYLRRLSQRQHIFMQVGIVGQATPRH